MNTKQETCIRAVKFNDLPALKAVIDANQLFPSDMLEEMISDYFHNQDSNDYWFTYDDHKPVAIGYCAPEKMTEGTWNLYVIAVHPDLQGLGYGTSMMHHIEQKLAKNGARILLVETSGLESFEPTRQFYQKCGYEKEAQIREFYQAGEDKIIFRKSLTNV
ncbi:MAG: GNAT family N-acetyltransferase [Cyanobacteria bacterium P01_G01_bin.39]